MAGKYDKNCTTEMRKSIRESDEILLHTTHPHPHPHSHPQTQTHTDTHLARLEKPTSDIRLAY